MDPLEVEDADDVIEAPPLAQMSIEQIMTYYTDDPIKAEAMYLRARGVYVSDLVVLNAAGHRVRPDTGEIVEHDYDANHSSG